MSKLLREKAEEFLERIWEADHIDARYIEVVLIGPRGVRPKQFDTLIEGGYKKAITQALDWIDENLEGGDHVYYAILPRKEKAPPRKRGSSKDVSVGKWLWADLDFKEQTEEAGAPECIEGEDHRLECTYEEGSKIIRVKRPPLSDILKSLREKGLEPTIIVDSGAGYHFYWELEDVVDSRQLSRLENLLIDTLKDLGYPVDPQTRDLARILRLPGSINPRVNRIVKVLVDSQKTYAPEELRAKLEELRIKREELSRRAGGLRELRDADIIAIKESLKEAWIPGRRQYLALFLTGWLAKAQVSPLSAARLIRALAEETGDSELEERLSTIYYSYRKALGERAQEALVELDNLIEEWKSLGVISRNVSRGVQYEGLVKGKTGVQEILEEVLGEERALDIIREIENILGAASPYRDSIIEIVDYEKQLYAVANLRKLVVVRAKRENGKMRYKERVAIGAPTELIVYIDPLGGVTKYKVRWETKTRPRPLVVGPAVFEDIIERLKVEGLIGSRRLAPDILSFIFEGFIRKGRAEIREEIGAPGFFLLRDKIIVNGWDLQEVTLEELREALELLDELARVWFKYAKERFSTIIKWGIIAPFNYIYKQKGKWIPWLYLYGSSYTGKTTLGEIVLEMWGLDQRYKKTGSSIDTVPRLGHILEQSTFMILVNEPGAAIYKEDIIEVMKNAIESPIARGKYVRGTYRDIRSLAPLILTSNKVLPRDDALLRPDRMIVLRFTYGERISREKAQIFKDQVKPELRKLKAIGYWVAKKILENPGLLDKDWKTLGEHLLTEAYREAGLEPPEWVKLWSETEENIYEDIKETIRSYLVKRINEEYSRFVGRIQVVEYVGSGETEERITYKDREEVNLEERIRVVINQRLLPWAIPIEKDGVLEVVLTTDFAREIRSIVGDIGGLKSLAELLGWEYKKDKKVKGRNIQAIIVKFTDLLEFLTG